MRPGGRPAGRHLPNQLHDILRDLAISQVAEAADGVSAAAVNHVSDPVAFDASRETLERALMRLRMLDAGQPLPYPDIEALATSALERRTSTLRSLVEAPDPTQVPFATIAETAERCVELAALNSHARAHRGIV